MIIISINSLNQLPFSVKYVRTNPIMEFKIKLTALKLDDIQYRLVLQDRRAASPNNGEIIEMKGLNRMKQILPGYPKKSNRSSA